MHYGIFENHHLVIIEKTEMKLSNTVQRVFSINHIYIFFLTYHIWFKQILLHDSLYNMVTNLTYKQCRIRTKALNTNKVLLLYSV